MHVDADIQDEALPEPGSPEDLEQRLRLMPLGDTVRGFIFTSLVESVRHEGDPEALQRCLTLTGGDTYLAFFNYPAAALLRLSYTAAWALSEKYGGFEGAMRKLGSRAVPDFFQSTVGKMMLGVAGMEAKRLFGWVPIIYPTIYHHGSYKLVWTGDKSGRVLLSGSLFSAPFIEAAMTHMLAPFELPEFSMRARRVGTLKSELVFSWR